MLLFEDVISRDYSETELDVYRTVISHPPTDNDMKLVANLQGEARPFVQLYVNERSKMLYMLVRSKASQGDRVFYLMTCVTSPEVDAYLNQKKQLRSLFARKKFAVLHRVRGHGLEVDNESKIGKSSMSLKGNFDPEYCSDPIRIITWIRRHEQNEYADI